MLSAALHISRTLLRAPKFFVVAVLVAACALLGASQARPTVLSATTTTLGLSATTIAPGGTVTLTATVTGATAPIGSVVFASQQSGGGLTNYPGTLSAINGTQSQSTLTVSGWAGGSYTIVASFRTSDGGSWGNSSSAGQTLTVTSVVVHNTQMALSASPLTLNQGDFTTLSATVSETDGDGIPTGIVSFHANQNGTDSLLGTAPLDSTGTATLPTGPWLAGEYTIIASYEGDVFDHSAGAQLPLTVGSGSNGLKDTTTTVIVSPLSIHAGDTVVLDATVLQTGTSQHPPAGDAVEFRANGIFLGQTDLGSDGHAAITVGGWLSGSYTIEADYVGNLFYKSSSGQTTLSVTDPLPTTLTYTGATSSLYGAPVTLKAVLIDSTSGLPLSGKTVAISVNAGHPGGELTCNATTDANGVAQCSTTMTLQPGSYPIAAAFAGSGPYLASGDNNTMVVSPIHTTTTASNVSTTKGTPTTLTGHLVDQFGNLLPTGTSVTLSIAGHSETCTGTTDASGNVSCQITPSENAGSYTINASFAGINESDGVTPIYIGSAGTAIMTIVNGIPTLIPYTGDTAVQQGSSAHISFVLKNKNTTAVLPNEPVTVTFDGQTFNLTSDGSGVVQTNWVVNDPAGSNLPAVATFGGDSPYLGSTGSGNVFVTAPTTLTYTGPSVVTEGSNGGKTLISFVLKDGQGNVLPNQKVNLALGSQTCTNLITDATGSVSCLVTTPAPGQPGGYTPTASYTKTTNYGASTGVGSFIVIAPTTLSYTGDTTATRGGTTTLKGVLKDGVTGGVLPGQSVTWTLGTGPTAQSCTAITDATGLASCTVTNAQLPSATAYPVTGSFGGATYYLPSSATGAVLVSPTLLTVTADNKSITQGSPIPPLTYVITGFVNGDTLSTSDVVGVASCSTTATSSSPIGAYPIVCTIGSLSSTNYVFRFVAGQISVVAPDFGCGGTIPGASKCESVIADPSPAQGAQVTPGQTMSVVYMDDSPLPATGASVSLNGQVVPITVTATSGYTQNYVDTWGGSASTRYESLITFQVPANLANGQYWFIVTVYDGDGDGDQWAWSVGVGTHGVGGGGGSTGTPTLMSLSALNSTVAGNPLTLTGTLTSAGHAVPNEPVVLSVNYENPAYASSNVSCTATTNNSGVASCVVTPAILGGIEVDAKFAGDSKYAPSSDAQDTNAVAALPTSLVVSSVPSMVQVNKQFTVTATLTSGGAGLASENLAFTIGSVTCTGKTNGSGIASCNITPNASGPAVVTVSFAGDSHAAASVSQNTTVVTTFPTVLTLSAAPSFAPKIASTVSATLTSNGAPVNNERITFAIGSVTCNANTNASGGASCALTPTAAGSGTLTATFAGDSTYAAASAAPQSINVVLLPTSLAVTSVSSLVLNKAGTVNVALTANGVPVANETVSCTIGSVTVTSKTNGSGVAACNITPKAAGAQTLTVSFTGDVTYAAAATVTQSVTVAAS